MTASLELIVAYFGLVMVFITWGFDKAEIFGNNKLFRKIIGFSYIALGILLIAIFYLYVN